MYKVGDKVKVVRNCNPRMKSYVGKHGRVTGGLTPHSCRVKLAYDEEVWLEFREIEPYDGKDSDVPETETQKPKTRARRGRQ